MAGLTRLELATFRVTGGRSNQLSYSPEYIREKMAPRAGLEPATQRLTVVCSTTELPRNMSKYSKTIVLFSRRQFLNNKNNVFETKKRLSNDRIFRYPVADGTCVIFGGRCRARTYDPQFVRLMLYH